MLHSLLADQLPAVKQILRKNGVKKAYAFGSVCTDAFNETSDIDLLVTFDETLSPTQYGENYFTIAHALESLLNRSVDLLTEQSLQNPYFIARLNKTKTLIYE